MPNAPPILPLLSAHACLKDAFDQALLEAMLDLGGPLPHWSWLKASLPGGLGIRRASLTLRLPMLVHLTNRRSLSLEYSVVSPPPQTTCPRAAQWKYLEELPLEIC